MLTYLLNRTVDQNEKQLNKKGQEMWHSVNIIQKSNVKDLKMNFSQFKLSATSTADKLTASAHNHLVILKCPQNSQLTNILYINTESNMIISLLIMHVLQVN